ncbi:MAG: YbaB/EbfC family nucleoid-associated protein [Mariniblastus sp.]|nr:YbaB/EbfC family nucleoid-associated protein [Mariniblastus sp.]
MFKGLGNIASLVNQARTMGPKMQEAMEQLKTKQVTGAAGGGMVSVTANGTGQVVEIKIDPVLAEKNDLEMVTDLLPAAINDALAKAKVLHMEAMQSVTGDLPVPDNMENMLKQILGGDESGPGTSTE